jgi:hypothetical protein
MANTKNVTAQPRAASPVRSRAQSLASVRRQNAIKLTKAVDDEVRLALRGGVRLRSVIVEQPFAPLQGMLESLMRLDHEQAKQTLALLEHDPAAPRENPFTDEAVRLLRRSLVRAADVIQIRLARAIRNGVLPVSPESLEDARGKTLRACFRQLHRHYPLLARRFDDSARKRIEAALKRNVKLPPETKSQRRRSPEERKRKALLTHHQFDGESCLTWTPIAAKDMAAHLNLSKAVISDFFQRHFEGHVNYRRLCHRDAGDALVAVLQVMAGPPATRVVVRSHVGTRRKEASAGSRKRRRTTR